MIIQQARLCLPLAFLLSTSLSAQSIINEWSVGAKKTLAFVGDLNGDGISDLLVGGGPGGPGSMTIGAYDSSTGNLLYTVGDFSNGDLGRSMAGIGDTDGDGVADFVVGKAHYVRQVSGVDGSTIREVSASDNVFGKTLAYTGDVDGDGIGDWATATRYSLLVYSGASGQVLRVLLAPPFLDTNEPYLQNAGDLDGDGHDELLMAWVHQGGIDVVELLSGANGRVLQSWSAEMSGPQPTCLVGDVDGDGQADVAMLDLSSGRVLTYSTQSGALVASLDVTHHDWSRVVLAAAGDMNGDGLDDLWVGFPLAGSTVGSLLLHPRSGAAEVYSVASGQMLLRHLGWGGGVELGSAIASGADIDGDGIGDSAILIHPFLSGNPGVRIVAGACSDPLGRTFCPTSPNSAGPGAQLGLRAPAYTSALTLDVSLKGGVPGSYGLLKINLDPLPPMPWASGIACLRSSLLTMGGMVYHGRVVWISGILPTDAAGSFSVSVPLVDLHLALVPGDTIYMQYMYRDAAGPLGTYYNLSDGYRVTFCQ